MLKSALVGCGNIGRGHAKAYQETREIEMAAVVDVVEARAKALGEAHDVPWFTSVDEVLGRDDIDVIDVGVPSGLHGEVALAAAAAGKHCICEKPLDVTPQRCDEIVAAFDQAGTVLGGIYQHRYADDVRRLKDAIDAGRLGRLSLLNCLTPWWRTQEYYDSGDWRGTWELDGGGALMNQSIHAIDLMLWFGGPLKRLQAYATLLTHERIEVEDVSVAVCEFECGAFGVIQGTTAAYPGSGVEHQVMGNAGMVYLTGDKIDLWKLKDEEGGEAKEDADRGEDVGAAADPTVMHGNLFARNLDDIARAARTGGEPLVTGREHKRAVEVICAIYESARSGREVTLPLKEFTPK